jgi:pyrimidine-nucleoside phosphorylase
VRYIDAPERLPVAPVQRDVPAPRSGYVTAIDGMALGLAVKALGGGRARKDAPIDPAVGLVLRARIGAAVSAGAPLATIHAASDADAEQVLPGLIAAFTLGDAPVAPPALVEEIIKEV